MIPPPIALGSIYPDTDELICGAEKWVVKLRNGQWYYITFGAPVEEGIDRVHTWLERK